MVLVGLLIYHIQNEFDHQPFGFMRNFLHSDQFD
ncbi:hypothetical protein T08_10957 [Trichinella sp. T8]|nr:hypothetical protein T08_10957 [Trichinella sp. T8]